MTSENWSDAENDMIVAAWFPMLGAELGGTPDKQGGAEPGIASGDGWSPAPGTSVIAEVYPRLWSAAYPVEGRSADRHDAYSVARWLQQADLEGNLQYAPQPLEPQPIATTAMVEGWILGVEWSEALKLSARRTKAKPTPHRTPHTRANPDRLR